MRTRFTLDKQNGKLMGVCAGIARMTGWDVTLVRVATVVACFFVHPLVIAYFVAAWIGRPAPQSRFDGTEAPRPRASMSTYDMKHRMGDFDRRLAEIDSCMASADSPLAREIEKLR